MQVQPLIAALEFFAVSFLSFVLEIVMEPKLKEICEMRSVDQYQILLQGPVQAEFMDLTIWLLRMLCWSQSITGAARRDDNL